MRILIADGDGGYRHSVAVIDEFAATLATRLGARPPVRVQWPEPDETRLRRPRSWDAASAAGVADLARIVRLHPSDEIILLGSRCGCRVVQDCLEAYPDQVDRVVGVGLMADPCRPHGRSLPGSGDPGGRGVAGGRVGPIPDRTFWVTVPGDPLSDVGKDSLLRATVRDSALTPDQVYRGLLEDLPASRTKMAARLHVFQHPTEWASVFGRRLDEARDQLVRYGDGGYISQYTAPGPGGRSPLDVLGDQLVEEALLRRDASGPAAPWARRAS
ncbi:hypothetical protein [Rhodococcus sp. IEGM 1408]|uniref:hypothetical protein n=1 Tax=Rhodococcus sp. IEGM 1408 TaxID=3082220 RepID=UPI0029549631|nr:hypothetical protein [Rhodococcus sp. IEGM 1408]MDV7999940.1 hypothetical protein [Rhodococcus sp. IEGM 1408]